MYREITSTGIGQVIRKALPKIRRAASRKFGHATATGCLISAYASADTGKAANFANNTLSFMNTKKIVNEKCCVAYRHKECGGELKFLARLGVYRIEGVVEVVALVCEKCGELVTNAEEKKIYREIVSVRDDGNGNKTTP